MRQPYVKKVTGTTDTESRSPKHHSSTTEAMCGSTQPGPTNWTSGPRDLDLWTGLLCSHAHWTTTSYAGASTRIFTASWSPKTLFYPTSQLDTMVKRNCWVSTT